MAHADYPLLNNLIKSLDDERSDIFVHINLSSVDFKESMIDKPTHSSLYFVPRIRVSWGSESQLDCSIRLFYYAVSTNQYEYYHLLSGSDLPLKNQDYINEFFDKNKGKEFISLYNIDSNDYATKYRYQYYHIFQDEIGRDRDKSPFYENEIEVIKTQRLLNIDRTVDSGFTYYKSMPFYSLTHDAVIYLLQKWETIKKYFYKCFAGEEHAFITLLMNSPFKEKIAKNDLREFTFSSYIPPSVPYIFRSKDYDYLIKSSKLFARKFSTEIDSNIINKIVDYVVSNKETSSTSDYYNSIYLEEYCAKISKFDGYIALSICGSYTKLKPINRLIGREIERELPFAAIIDNINGMIRLSNPHSTKCQVSYHNIMIASQIYINNKNIGKTQLTVDKDDYYLKNDYGLNIFLLDRNLSLYDYVHVGSISSNTDYITRPTIVKGRHPLVPDYELLKYLESPVLTEWESFEFLNILVKRPNNEQYIKEYIKKQIDLNNPYIYEFLGDCYSRGIIFDKDVENALHYYYLAISKKIIRVIPKTVDLLWSLGNQKSDMKVKELLEKFKDSANVDIQLRICRMNLRSDNEETISKTIDSLNELLFLGNPSVKYDLMYAYWKSTNPSSDLNLLNMIMPMVKNNDGLAMAYYARLLSKGGVVEKNTDLAIEYYNKADARGVWFAKIELNKLTEKR